uniref:Uncharacterized protein n=1 Tax=viral metagenome TaxID=1070528 RepID=A0A6C0KUH1_9ZZZZ
MQKTMITPGSSVAMQLRGRNLLVKRQAKLEAAAAAATDKSRKPLRLNIKAVLKDGIEITAKYMGYFVLLTSTFNYIHYVNLNRKIKEFLNHTKDNQTKNNDQTKDNNQSEKKEK